MHPHILTLTATALLTAAALPAAAAGPGDNSGAAISEASSTAAAPQKEEKKVCKMIEKSGSHMAKRVCLTKDEWEKINNDDF